MREIKFRAWDDADGVHRDEGCMSYGITDITCDAAHIMQYTGLKDMNGKDIYEGDIILIENQKTQIQQKKAICTIAMSYRGGYCAIIEKVIKWENFRLDPPTPKTHIYFFNILDTLVYEVIGNIYENPELLENDKEGR